MSQLDLATKNDRPPCYNDYTNYLKFQFCHQSNSQFQFEYFGVINFEEENQAKQFLCYGYVSKHSKH